MRALRVLLLAGLAGATGALFIRVLLTSQLNTSPCGTVPPVHGAIAPGVYAAAAAGAFVLGGLFGVWRTRAAAGAGPAGTMRADLTIHAALAVFLAALVAALIYETYALANPPTWPITYYIRCANLVAPGWTLLGAAALSGLLGHWFWRPSGGGTSPRGLPGAAGCAAPPPSAR